MAEPASFVPNGKERLGELLQAKGLITNDDLHRALLLQRAKGQPLGEVLQSIGAVTPQDLLEVLSEMLDVPSIQLSKTYGDPLILEYLPKSKAYDLLAIPLFLVDNQLTVALTDPQNLETLDRLQFITGSQIMPVLALEDDIKNHLKLYYGDQDSDQDLGTIEFESPNGEMVEDSIELEGAEDQRPVVRLVNLIIIRAIQEEASDIHLEPHENKMVVRYRIDGRLKINPYAIPQSAIAGVTSRIKILSDCDISERRIPQDGKMRVRYNNRRIDVRVSTFPSIHGEKTVLRLLDKERQNFDLENIGMTESVSEQWQKILKQHEGIVLVTGPTGSGKSSTLFATLQHISRPDVNIVTLEDPVEYEIEGITQGQVNERAGFTFGAGLRSILRQDPDVILVGEIRDLETAQIAVQAALTGHLVLASLHTNDAPSAITRLIDMGLQRFMVGSAVIGVLAQRLVRRLCNKCGHNVEPRDEDRKIFESWLDQDIPYATGKGCGACHETGYRGRVGVHELLTIDANTRQLIISGAEESEIRVAGRGSGYRPLWFDGLEKVIDGTTSLTELARAVSPPE